jgi:23S rRNA (cytidine1920-2'-O)/16S rRNA (cytidine1409-2'-O)-methyltransferase
MAGEVRVEGEVVAKAGQQVAVDARVEIRSGAYYVSRSAEKLRGGLDQWGLSPKGRVCADVGSSTGGFTQVLLEYGAEKVYAIDVGQNELAWKLRNDPRVVCMERTNARSLERLPEPIGFASIDVSFISCAVLLPVVKGWFETLAGDIAVLIKPQFEARREEVPAGGVVADPDVHRWVLRQILGERLPRGCQLQGLIPAWPKGQSGNQEYLAWLGVTAGTEARREARHTEELIELAVLKAGEGGQRPPEVE